MASHDLQEPLRNIVSFSQLLERRYKGKLDQDADEYIAFIVEGGVRMQALIRDLLHLSRIETQAHHPVPIGAGAVVADAVSALEPLICGRGDRHGRPDADRHGGPGAARAGLREPDRQRDQVPDGPVVPPEIRIGAEREGRCWRFAVADNGIGIEPEYLDRIFVIFQRLHTQDDYEGTGIGLAVVKKIVERHGGTVRVESTPGEGSTFYFTLTAA